MGNTIYHHDPDVNHLVVVNRGKDGKRRLVMELDTDLSEARPDTYEVNIVTRDSDGQTRVKGGSARKKQTRMLRPMEKITRKSARNGIRLMQDYLYLHERSNRKKKNGWFQDYSKNVRKALRRSFN